MATVEDQIIDTQAKVTALTGAVADLATAVADVKAAVSAIPAATVDPAAFQPIMDAVGAVGAKVDTVISDLSATPAAVVAALPTA